MRARRGGPALVAAALVGLALMSASLPAAAALDPGDYVVRKRDVPIAGSLPGLGGGHVRCGRGLRVVTGGAFWHQELDGPGPLLSVYLSSSTPTPDGKGWFASGINWGDDAILRVVAYCLPTSQVGTYTVRTSDVAVASQAVAIHDPRCPKGTRIVTGGAFWHQGDLDPDPSVQSYLRSSAPDRDARGWYFSGLNDDGDLHLMAVALCLPAAALGRFAVRTVEVPVPDGAGGAGGGSCGSGRRAVGGGALWHAPGEGRDPALSAYVSGSFPKRLGRRWSIQGYNSSGSALEMRIIVMCLPT